MIPMDSIILFIFASALLCITPGPDNIFVLSQSAFYGKKFGIFITLGLCTGLVFHTSAVALGLAILIQDSPLIFAVLKIIGASYLVYLAWLSFRSKGGKINLEEQQKIVGFKLFKRGIIMNVTNPKVSIFFLAFLPQFTEISYGPIGVQIILLGGLFILTALVIFICISLIASKLGTLFQRSPKIQIFLDRASGTIFILLAINLILGQA